ncbi:MAG: protocatechuate 3,4-dioxygenase beta subunit [Alphaproteobacteria bacterium]|jgi:protocatechuate 3,4-dioxygenase beta subunit
MTFTRRGLILAAPTLFAIGPAWAATAPTPLAAEGPFYPVEIPTDHDNDLVRIDSMVREAGGEILELRGIVTDIEARPITGAAVEIWQCDSNGVYRHPGDPRPKLRDAAFQGFGRTTTDGNGRFRFRTIVPVPYPGRAPHIHAKIRADGRPALTTQFYRADYPDNSRDFLFNRMNSDERERVSMTIRPQSGKDRTPWETEIVAVLPNV